MTIDTTRRDGNLPLLDAKCALSGRTRPRVTGSRAVTAAIWLGCAVVSAIPMATTASAHVKWFVTCNAADDPLPPQAVFTPTFWLFSALFVTLLYVGCAIEETKLGASLSGLLDRWTEPLYKRADGLLRAVAAVSFTLLWADGDCILTPELKGSGIWLSAIQVLIPIYLIARATLPAAAAGILVLYGYGAAAGIVEFGLAFALFWTPLVRRFAAAALSLLLFSATFDFGKMDGIGHLMIIALLLLVFADPGRKQASCSPAVAPLVGGATLLAVIFLYAGFHTLYYGASPAALVPLASGAALAALAISFLCLPGLAHGLRRAIRRRLLLWLIERDEAGDTLTVQRPRDLATPRRVTRSERLVAVRAHG